MASDENFRGDIVAGLMLQQPNLPLVRIQDEGLLGAEDPAILDWAAQEKRILLTHDYKTMPHFAYQRIAAGLAMPGVFVMSNRIPAGQAIDEILLLAVASLEDEWEGRVLYLPSH
jgi:hypothetical protein